MVSKVEQEIFEHIENRQNFILDAGAGSGKTWTLVQTLYYLIKTKSKELKQNNQKIVCITYTNIAKDEIIERIEHNALIIVSTIHDFLWDCVKTFQKELKLILIEIVEERIKKEQIKLDGYTDRAIISRENSEKKISKYTEARDQLETNKIQIRYENYTRYSKGKFSHDDLIVIAEKIFSSHPKICKIITDTYPIILVDEYQDTQKETVEILLNYLLGSKNFIVGFFGDKIQQIYDTGVGNIPEKYKLKRIVKLENYRSSKEVIALLNRLRVDIEQYQPKVNNRTGNIAFYYVQDPDRFNVSEFIKENLLDSWNIKSTNNIKILYLTHRYIAKENQYEDILLHYSRANKRDAIIDNVNNRTLCPFADYLYDLEDLINLFKNNRIQQFLRKVYYKVDSFIDKKKLYELMQQLIVARQQENIKSIMDYCISNNILPKSNQIDYYDFEDERKKEFYEDLMKIEYSQFSRLYNVQMENTSFSTKHNTKGDEFNNVLVIIDDNSWKQKFNFNDYFSKITENEERYNRTNNLFYVVCSRAKNNLAIANISTLSNEAQTQIKVWFGEENYYEYSPN